MIKHFCDCCGNEVRRNYVADRLRGKTTIKQARAELEVHVAINGVWNGGDLCADCLYVTLDRLDPRVRASEVA